MFDTFKFGIRDAFEDWDTIEITKHGDAYEVEIDAAFYMAFDNPRRASTLIVELFDNKLTEIGVKDWQPDYAENGILDGVEWTLRINNQEYCGVNAFPEGFDDLTHLLYDLFDFPEIPAYES